VDGTVCSECETEFDHLHAVVHRGEDVHISEPGLNMIFDADGGVDVAKLKIEQALREVGGGMDVRRSRRGGASAIATSNARLRRMPEMHRRGCGWGTCGG
jgi:hypothetical protein